jgi:hypothetical protein
MGISPSVNPPDSSRCSLPCLKGEDSAPIKPLDPLGVATVLIRAAGVPSPA